MSHIMVDLETLDTRSTAVIVSIGAVKFNPYDSSEPFDCFYRVLDIEAQLEAGRTVSGSTIAWWMEQSNSARSVFSVDAERKTSAVGALLQFSDFCEKVDGVWGNGSDFDNAILASANATFEVKGWGYYRNRCYRTLKNAAHQTLPDLRAPERQGTHHNALDDAAFQMEHLQLILKETGCGCDHLRVPALRQYRDRTVRLHTGRGRHLALCEMHRTTRH